MPLIPKHVPDEARGRMQIHPTATAATALRAYAEFNNAPGNIDYVINTLAPRLHEIDPEFKAWLAAHPEAGKVTKAGKTTTKKAGLPAEPTAKPPSEQATKSSANNNRTIDLPGRERLGAAASQLAAR